MKYLSAILAIALSTATPLLAHAQPLVIFDEGHGQRFNLSDDGPLQLSGLAKIFEQRQVTTVGHASRLTPAVLQNTSALLISGPFIPFANDEIEAIYEYVAKGGRVAIMLHVAPPAASLLHRLGVDVSNGTVRERANIIDANSLNFYLSQTQPHQLVTGLQHIGVYGSWALRNTGDNAAVIASTSPQAWIDLDRSGSLTGADATGTFGIVVAGNIGKGRFVVFGDDALFQNKFLTGNNVLLAERLVDWLISD